MEKVELSNINWDNDFSIRFRIKNKQQTQLNYIPNNIFSIQLPSIMSVDLNTNQCSDKLILTLRSTKDGNVEKEILSVLFANTFDIDVSLSNPNETPWMFSNCSIDKIQFSTLVDKKSHTNPFNLIVSITVGKITYKTSSEMIVIGNDEIEHRQEG